MSNINKNIVRALNNAPAAKYAAKAVKKTTGKTAAKKIASKIDPTETLKILVEAYRECATVTEQETTKRREIEAKEKTVLTELKYRRELFMTYLERSFDERKENFQNLFKTLDKAIDTNSSEVFLHTLNSITELAKSSPFKDLASVSAVRDLLDDPSKQIEF